MQLSLKDYKILKTKKYIKTNSVFFFANGTSKNSLDWLSTEQDLKTVKFNYYKLFNKTGIKTLNNSIYKNVRSIVNGLTFFIKPNSNKPLLKQTVANSLDSLLFELLLIKFNNKLYPSSVFENLYAFNYKKTKLLLYQFKLTNLKLCSKFSK